LQYHTDIDKVLTDLAKKMAKCNVTQNDKEFLEELNEIFMQKIQWAVDIQRKTGPKAAFCRTPLLFTPVEEAREDGRKRGRKEQINA
jgi:hypothetical protein